MDTKRVRISTIEQVQLCLISQRNQAYLRRNRDGRRPIPTIGSIFREGQSHSRTGGSYREDACRLRTKAARRPTSGRLPLYIYDRLCALDSWLCETECCNLHGSARLCEGECAGTRTEAGEVGLPKLEAYMLKKNGADTNTSGRQKMVENLINEHI